MAAHRYWRASAIEAYGAGDLELSEFQLLSNDVRADAPATLTANIAPDVSGTLGNLQDDVLTTSARWSRPLVAGLIIQWDFGGSPSDVGACRLSGNSEARFPLMLKLAWSDDASTWTDLPALSGIKWPGVGAKTETGETLPDGTLVALRCEGANGSTALIDETGRAWTTTGSFIISTTRSKYGGSSAYSPNDASGAYLPYFAGINLGTGSFTIKGWVYFTGSSTTSEICAHRAGGILDFWLLRRNSDGTIRFTNILAGASQINLVGGLVSANTWVHIALVRDGNTFTLWVAGTAVASGSSSAPMAAPAAAFWFMQGDNSGSGGWTGYVDDFAIVKGEAEYTTAFTPGQSFGLKSTLKNYVRGRSAFDSLSLATFAVGPIVNYGSPFLAQPVYLGVESGSVKDQITGVLGQGIGRVRGTVKITPATPTHRKVRLIRQRDNMLIREQWSDVATGEYDFKYVDELQTFTVLSYDYSGAYRAVVADGIVPELMP